MSPAIPDPGPGPRPDTFAARMRLHRIPKLAEIIAAELRARILGGELTPGESLLGEASLMEQYQVSRPTLREALRLLEAQDLITVRRGSHRGPVVAHPDVGVVARAVAIQLQLRGATLADVYQFRMIYEPLAARMAAENATAEGIAALRELLAAERDALGDFGVFANASWRFHSVLIGMAGNATMDVVTESLRHISEQNAVRAMAAAPDRASWPERSLKAHRKLVTLIAKGSAAEAERFWAKHMAAVAELQRGWSSNHKITELLEP